MVTRKYTGFARAERTISAAATNQFGALQYDCEDQGGETIVSVHVEIALNPENLTDGGSSNVAGYARLVVNRSGNTIPVIVPSTDWDTTAVADAINDEDAGDTWAITPFAFGTAFVGAVIPAGAGLSGTTGVHLILSPKTKRSLRKGDALIVELQYSNSGTGGAQPIQECITGTLFVTGT